MFVNKTHPQRIAHQNSRANKAAHPHGPADTSQGQKSPLHQRQHNGSHEARAGAAGWKEGWTAFSQGIVGLMCGDGEDRKAGGEERWEEP